MPHPLHPLASHPITWWQSIVLGLVQGLTEFIPVSSSAHLNIAHWLFHQGRDLPFDVMLHIGTTLALAFYFRHDWMQLVSNPEQKKLRNYVFIACVPAALAGVALRHLEDHPPLSEVWFNAIMLAVMGVVLGIADAVGRKKRELADVGLKDAILVGCSQALALVPGVSRSGATITTGLLLQMTRESAARFSFLMSLPITLGAVSFEVLGIAKEGNLTHLNADLPIVLLGIAVSAISGFCAISFLLSYLRKHSVLLFVAWRVIVAAAVLILWNAGFK